MEYLVMIVDKRNKNSYPVTTVSKNVDTAILDAIDHVSIIYQVDKKHLQFVDYKVMT